MFNQIVDLKPGMLATAKHVLVGGEALSVSHILKARRALPHVTFGNGYGPTECTTFACSWIIGPPDTWGCDSVPLGFPINNTECHIVDADLRPVPVGVVGELLLGGDGLARGYYKRPDLTAERFIRHPFSDAPDARLYRTGDRCYWLPNGMIAYVGRDDDQVKLRSFRIELNEVEAALRLSPGIANAAAIVREFRSGVRSLVGFVVLEPGRAWDEESALTDVARRLPEFMLPKHLFSIDALPLTQNGKVDREALARRLVDDEATVEPTSKVAPTTLSDLEQALVDTWRKVLIEDIASTLVEQVRRVCPNGSEAGERVEDLILWEGYPYKGRVHVITSEQEHEGVFDRLVPARDAGSAVVPAGRLSMFELPCGHFDILKPPHRDALIRKTLDILERSRSSATVLDCPASPA